jgi:GTP-binding protein Era
MATAAELGDFTALHPVSAKTGDGIGELRHELVGLLMDGQVHFSRDAHTDLPLDAQISELVREKALALTREEVPHAVSVEVDAVEDRTVRASIYVETESQKQIVVGKGGRIVREIGTRARPEIEALLGRGIFLDLQVKVRPHWRRDDAMLERLGL